MTKIEITNGTDAQNRYASDIASKWAAQVEDEIQSVTRRIDDQGYSASLAAYKAKLESMFARMIPSVQQMRAGDIIAGHKSGRSFASAVIEAARKA